MPGLAAVIGPAFSPDRIEAMIRSMFHEPFYTAHRFADSRLSVGAARVGPPVPSPDPQPAWSEDRTLLGMMEGEIFNGESIRRTRASSGRAPAGGSDLDLLLRLFEEKGEAFLDGVRGRFVLFFYDARAGRAWIATDRLGFAPLFYAEVAGSILVASEVKALLATRSIERTLDETSLREFFRLQTVTGDRTLFRKIRRIPPASLWSFEKGCLTQKRYADPRRLLDLPELEEEEYGLRAEESLRRAVGEACADGRAGLSLTGGWDTRTLVALLPPGRRVPCFTLTGPGRTCADARLAKRVAAASGQEHHVVRIPGDFLRRFPEHAERTVLLSDGMAGIERAHEILLNARAREFCAARIAGTHASQIVRGSSLLRNRLPDRRFFHADFRAFLDDTPEEGAGAFLAGVREGRIGNREILLFLLNEELRQGAIAGNHALELSQIWIRTPYTDEEFVETMFRAPGCPQGARIGERLLHRSTGDRVRHRLRGLFGKEPSLALQQRILDRNAPRLLRIPVNLGEEPLARSGPGGALWRIYAGGLGLADTFHASFEYPGRAAALDRWIRSSHIERLFLGFHSYVHYRTWLMRELGGYVREILLDSKTLGRGCFDRDFLERAVLDHASGRRCHSSALAFFLTFELWNRLFAD
jgi:asparagine synthase (glutamine-hydrolysing)